MTTPAVGLYPSIAARLATDPAKLGLATFLKVTPILAAYVPSPALALSALTLGTGTLAPVATTVVTTSGVDPVTGQYKILVPPPVGGWKWTYDAVAPAPPVTIYGYALTDVATGLVLLAVTDLLPDPITLSIASLVILDEMSMLLLAPPLQ